MKEIGIDRPGGGAYADETAMSSTHVTIRLVGFVVATALACTPGGDSGGSTTQDGTTQDSGSTGAGATTTAAGSSGQTDTAATGTPTSGGSSGGADTESAGPSFTEVYEGVLIPQGCTAGYCHGGMAGGLMMTDEATAYANLVDVAATTPVCGLTTRVVPGAPDESILWPRVRPAAQDMGMACAPKMPQGMPGLPDAEAQLVYDWIAAGALE